MVQCRDYSGMWTHQGCIAAPTLGLRGARAPSGRRWAPYGSHPPPWSSPGSGAPSARGPGRCWPRCWRTPGGRGLRPPPARPDPGLRTAVRAAAGPSPLAPGLPAVPATVYRLPSPEGHEAAEHTTIADKRRRDTEHRTPPAFPPQPPRDARRRKSRHLKITIRKKSANSTTHDEIHHLFDPDVVLLALIQSV